jgi:hypothetical protein
MNKKMEHIFSPVPIIAIVTFVAIFCCRKKKQIIVRHSRAETPPPSYEVAVTSPQPETPTLNDFGQFEDQEGKKSIRMSSREKRLRAMGRKLRKKN